MLKSLIIIKQYENITKTSQLTNQFSGNEDYRGTWRTYLENTLHKEQLLITIKAIMFIV